MRTVKALAFLFLAGCAEAPETQTEETLEAFNARLAALYESKPRGSSRAYALVKQGATVDDWLATFHGYVDNRATCEELIAPYNEDSSLSVMPGDYVCKELATQPAD